MSKTTKHHRTTPVKSTRPSTRHIVTDRRFAGFLSEDFGINVETVLKALAGEPQRESIALCIWAAERTEHPAEALLAWARKHRRGHFRKPRRSMSPAETRAMLYARHGAIA